MFDDVSEQEEAKRLLAAALEDGTAHAFLFAGPRGSGKRRAALAFAAALLGEHERVLRRTHPDLYVLEPLGGEIRIDAIRELRRDLHMRPFESSRRVYLVFGASTMNEDAADALLKDIEEPPPYAVVVLVADELGPVPETIRSRCQLIPFRRLSQRAIRAHLESLGARGEELERAARLAAGRLDRAERLLDPQMSHRRGLAVALARSVYQEERFDPVQAAEQLIGLARERASAARSEAEEAQVLGESAREAEQRARRAGRGAEREEVLEALETVESWYRDLLVTSLGASAAVVNADRLEELAQDARGPAGSGAERAVEVVRSTRRSFEYNVQTGLALEALFLRLRQVYRASLAAAARE